MHLSPEIEALYKRFEKTELAQDGSHFDQHVAEIHDSILMKRLIELQCAGVVLDEPSVMEISEHARDRAVGAAKRSQANENGFGSALLMANAVMEMTVTTQQLIPSDGELRVVGLGIIMVDALNQEEIDLLVNGFQDIYPTYHESEGYINLVLFSGLDDIFQDEGMLESVVEINRRKVHESFGRLLKAAGCYRDGLVPKYGVLSKMKNWVRLNF